MSGPFIDKRGFRRGVRESGAPVLDIRRRALGSGILAVGLMMSLSSPVSANPQGGQVSAGAASIATQGSALNVSQSSQRAVIDWRSFNIASGEQTNFDQPNASAIALNRVNDVNPSQIQGALTVNGPGAPAT